MEIEITIDANEIINKIRDKHSNSWVLNALDIDADALIDDIYFSEILDASIRQDQAATESDIADSGLDLVPSRDIYYTNKLPDIKRFFKESLQHRNSAETVLLALKNGAFEHGWNLTFTKTI